MVQIYFRNRLCYLLSQRLRLCPVQLSNKEFCSAHNILVYLVAFLFTSFPLLTMVGPQKLPYDPLQIIFNHVLNRMQPGTQKIIQLSFGIIYCIPTAYFAGLMFSLLSLICIDLEGILQYSGQLCTWQTNKGTAEFGKKYESIRILQMFINLTNNVGSNAMLVVVVIGIVIGSVCAYITVIGRATLTVYLPGPTILFLLLCINFGLLSLGSAPYRNVLKLRILWKRIMTSRHKMERL